MDLLAYVDKAHGNLSGPATRRILEREYGEYGQAAYQRLSAISVAHLYRLRNSAAYRKRNTSYQPTRPTPIPIGERRKPQPHGSPGYLRIDTVHQGDQDGRKGLYHINAVDQVTQWEIVAATPQISEFWLLPVLEAMLGQFPFVIRGFHSDNGSEFINYNVARLLDKLLIEQTKSRAHHSGDNGLVESKNGAIIRKHIGYGYIDAQHAEAMDQFHRQHLNPYVNFHRPCAVPKIITEANGKRRRVYLRWATPFELFQEVPHCEKLPAAGRHAGGTGSLRPDPIRYRSRSGHAARQAQALSKLPANRPLETSARASRWSAIGLCARPARCKSKPKNQNLPRRKNAPSFQAWERLPLVGPGGSQTLSERRLRTASLPPGFRLILR